MLQRCRADWMHLCWFQPWGRGRVQGRGLARGPGWARVERVKRPVAVAHFPWRRDFLSCHTSHFTGSYVSGRRVRGEAAHSLLA